MDYISELKLILPEPGDFPDVYAFSIHKCGSSMLFNMIYLACLLSKIPCISIPDKLFKKGILDTEWESDKRLLELHKPGIVYIGYRYLPSYMLNESGLEEFIKGKRKVLLVRDPRDALVSQYFSFGGYFSHELPEQNKEKVIKTYQRYKAMSIDQYVKENALYLYNKLDKYKKYLDFENVLLLKYEEVYFNKSKYLSEIFAHFGIKVDQQIINLAARLCDIRPQKEDITKHIRKGTPGDHKEKLSQETIDYLNNFFNEIASFYGYSLINSN